MLDVWTEKYRPKKLSEIKGQEQIIQRLKAFVSTKSMPHLLFAGPAGVGKTTSALALAKELYGENWRDYFFETNASDNRGIDYIREAIKSYARTAPIGDVPFKIIYLDECDALTREAQDALRRIMEDYTQTTRFILSCNYSSKIIPPIQSRCAIFRFKPLPKESVIEILQKVAENENLKVSNDVLELVYEASEGDMRKAHNLLQACAAISPVINLKVASEIISFAEPKEIREAILEALNGNFIKAKKLLFDTIVAHGLSGLDAIRQIQKEIQNLEINEKLKAQLIKICGEVEFRLVEGANEFIQLAALLAEFALVSETEQ
ncbi:MAG: replication factor C small subunit [Candidatus Nanoarchaeia archaeon]